MSTSPPKTSPTFLTIPIELRLQVYSLVISGVTNTPTTLTRVPKLHFLYRRPNYPAPPQILLVNKQIYLEVKDVLHEQCFRSKAHRVRVSHVSCRRNRSELKPPTDLNGMHSYVSARQSFYVLRSVPWLRLEVEVSDEYQEQAMVIGLLQWIKSVLNSRGGDELRGVVKKVEVVFNAAPIPGLQPKLLSVQDGFLQAVAGIRAIDGTEIWMSEQGRANNDLKQIKIEHIEVAAYQRGSEGAQKEADASEEITWGKMEETWERVQVEERKRARRDRSRWWVPSIYGLDEMT